MLQIINMLSFLFRLIMLNVSGQVEGEIKKKKFCANFLIENRTVYGIMWENILQAEGQQVTR